MVFENVFHQWIIALFSLMFGVLCVLFFAWFRYYKYTKYQQTMLFYAGFAVIEGISIAMGFVFYKLMDVKVHLIWTSFVILPFVVGTFIFFFGNLISNDYFFYDQKTNPPQANADATRVVDSAVAENKAAAKGESRLTEIQNETFCGDFAKLLCCGYLPRNRSTKDKMNFGRYSLPLLFSGGGLQRSPTHRLHHHHGLGL